MSIIILGMFALLELGPASPHFLPLLHALLPWALHHRHAVRVPVQVRAAVGGRAQWLGCVCGEKGGGEMVLTLASIRA